MERNIDELNLLFYKKYFEPMALSERQKEKRIKAARIFEDILYSFIMLVSLDPEFGIDQTTKEILLEEYADAVREFIDDPDFVTMYVALLAAFIEETTIKNMGQEYNTSYQRAMDLAADQANTVCNREEFIEFSIAGYKRKQWITEHDDKVRESHFEVEDVIVPINDFFVVGNAIMRFPHDFEYAYDHPEETVNCRCSLAYLR